MSISLYRHHILQHYSNYVSTILTPIARDMRSNKIDPYTHGSDNPNKSGFHLRPTCQIHKAPVALNPDPIGAERQVCHKFRYFG